MIEALAVIGFLWPFGVLLVVYNTKAGGRIADRLDDRFGRNPMPLLMMGLPVLLGLSVLVYLGFA